MFKPLSIANSKAGISKIFSKLSEYDPDEVVFGMEVSFNYWENIYSYLEEKKFKVMLLNPYQLKKYSQAMGNKTKTDSVDSTSIAKLLMGKSYEVLYLTDEAAITLRELVRTKHSFERRAKNLKKAILSTLNLVFPEYTKIINHPFSKVSTKKFQMSFKN